MDILDEEILNLWKSLYKEGVKYIMVGGFATNLHGFSRMTADLDIWIENSFENRKKLGKVLQDVQLANFRDIEKMDFVPGWSSIRMSSGFELDIMSRLKSLKEEDFEASYNSAPIAVIFDIPIHFLHLNQLIEEKKSCGRPKDLLDIVELEKIKGEPG